MAVVDPILLRSYDYGIVGPAAAREPVWADIKTISLAPVRYSAQKHLFPALYAATDLDTGQRVAISEAAQRWSETEDAPFIGLLINATQTIRPRLTKALVVKRPGVADRLLRYYDPRVYQHLRWILEPEQRAWLMAPASAWAWPDRNGHWQVDTQPEAVDGDTARAYTEAQLAQFERIEYIERAYQRLAKNAPETVTNAPATMQCLDAILARAMQHYGLDADRDLDMYVKHAMAVHPRIHEYPEMQARLMNVLRGQSYRGVCRDLDADTLQRYARELGDPRIRDGVVAAYG